MTSTVTELVPNVNKCWTGHLSLLLMGYESLMGYGSLMGYESRLPLQDVPPELCEISRKKFCDSKGASR